MKHIGLIQRTRLALLAAVAIGWACLARAGDEGKEYAYLGVYVESIPEMLGEHLGLQPGVGVVVEGVIEGGPADAAGLMKNDLILKFDDQLLIGTKQAVTLVKISEPGSVHELSIMRKGEKQTVSVTLGSKKIKAKKKAEEQSQMLPGAPAVPPLPLLERKHAIRGLRDLGMDRNRIVYLGESGEIDFETSMELNEEIETMVKRVQLAVSDVGGVAAPTIVLHDEERVFEFSDDSGMNYTVVDSGEECELTIVNADGKSEFEGIMDDEALAMLPESIRKELPRIQKIVRIEKIEAPKWGVPTPHEESF